MSTHLFSSFRLRELNFKNRIVVSPMCQYSGTDGVPGDWHLVHLGGFAVGGAALVMAEATAVSAIGRISPGDLGLWNDRQIEEFARITRFIRAQGAHAGVQLAHAGRKASVFEPWKGGGRLPEPDAWTTVAPSALAFSPDSATPRSLTLNEIAGIRAEFVAATERALRADFQLIELHFAHGYLVHQFLSPLSNQRVDSYGGSLANRMRLALEIAQDVRRVWPENRPLFVRVSASDWTEGGWDLQQTVELAKELVSCGVDLLDCSSGGNVAHAKIPVGPGYQVPFAESVRKQTSIATGAVGMITDPHAAEAIIANGQADLVLLAREMLRDPHWPLHAADALGADVPWPKQYDRARPQKR